jgi:hypothetical protein
MQTKAVLVLSFVVISLVPVSLLSAISFISLSKLQQNMSNLYFGTVTIITDLSNGHKDLLEMRLNMGRLISADSDQERQKFLADMGQNENGFLKTLIGYREIDDFPLQIEILERRGMGNLTSYEDSLLTEVNNNWQDYQDGRNKVIALSSARQREEAVAYSNTVVADRFSRLVSTYNKIVDLNNQLASIMYDESESVVRQAFAYGILASLSSAAFAFAAALLVSRRLAPSVNEIQQQARNKIEKFISEGRLFAAAPGRQKEVDIEPQNAPAVHPGQAPELAEKGPMMLLHFSQYRELKDSQLEGQEPRKTPAESLLGYYLAKPSEDAGKKVSPVLITKRSSNLYSLGRSSGLTMYILSSSSQEPISTAEDGLVISINQTSLILEAIKRTLQENASSVIILDNITELIHRLGFDRVFSLVQSISDVVSMHPSSRIVILINANAHPPNEVEAMATACNVFTR